MDDHGSPLKFEELAEKLGLSKLSKSSPSSLPPALKVKLSRNTTHQTSSHERQRSRPFNKTNGSSSSVGINKRKGMGWSREKEEVGKRAGKGFARAFSFFSFFLSFCTGNVTKRRRILKEKIGTVATDSNLSHVPCKFYKQGACTAGTNCPFSHNQLDLTSESSICKYFLKGNCRFGNKCALIHGASPSIAQSNAVVGAVPTSAVDAWVPRQAAYSSSPFQFGSFFSNHSSLLPVAPPPTLQQSQWHLTSSLSSSSSMPRPSLLGKMQTGDNSSSSNSTSMGGDDEDDSYCCRRGITIPGQRTAATNHLFRSLDDEGQDPFSPFPTTAGTGHMADDDVPMFFMQDDELSANDRTLRPSQNFAFPSVFRHNQYDSSSFSRS